MTQHGTALYVMTSSLGSAKAMERRQRAQLATPAAGLICAHPERSARFCEALILGLYLRAFPAPAALFQHLAGKQARLAARWQPSSIFRRHTMSAAAGTTRTACAVRPGTVPAAAALRAPRAQLPLPARQSRRQRRLVGRPAASSSAAPAAPAEVAADLEVLRRACKAKVGCQV